MSLRLSLSRTQLRVEMLLYLQVRQLLIMIHAAAGRLDRAPPRLPSDTLYSTWLDGPVERVGSFDSFRLQ